MAISKNKDPFFSHDKVTNRRKTIGIHFHDEHELYYLIDGKTKYVVGDKIFLLEKGNLVFVPARVLHSCDSEDCLYNERLLLSFPESSVSPTILPFLQELESDTLLSIPPDKLYWVEELFSRIEKEFLKERKHKQIMLNLYVSELILLLCRLKGEYTPNISPTNKIIYDVVDYIRHHFEQPLLLEQLSLQFNISEGYLSRKFKAVTGVGLSTFITQVRIIHAEKLLTETGYSIAEIAGQCGFNDSNYFAAVFKKIKGTTPYKFSKQAGKI